MNALEKLGWLKFLNDRWIRYYKGLMEIDIELTEKEVYFSDNMPNVSFDIILALAEVIKEIEEEKMKGNEKL